MPGLVARFVKSGLECFNKAWKKLSPTALMKSLSCVIKVKLVVDDIGLSVSGIS